MRVIYKGNSKKLIKNHIYKIECLYNDGTNSGWLEGILEINGIRFNVNSFIKENGEPLDKINIIKPITKKNELIVFSELKQGDIIVCITDSLKSLAKDKMYIIDNLETIRINTTPRPYSINYIWFKGINRRFIFSNWKFKKLEQEKTREISIESLLNNTSPNFVTNIPKRKIELSDNINKDLITLLAKSILDKNRHSLNVLDWGCQQLGTILSVEKEDYNELLDMKLSDILKLID